MAIDQHTVHHGGTIVKTGGITNKLEKLDDGAGYANFFVSGTNLLDQKTLKFSVKRPKVSPTAPGGFTQARNTLYLKVPFTLASGLVTYVSAKVEISVDPEYPEDENRYLRAMISDLLTDTELNDFWINQSVS